MFEKYVVFVEDGNLLNHRLPRYFPTFAIDVFFEHVCKMHVTWLLNRHTCSRNTANVLPRCTYFAHVFEKGARSSPPRAGWLAGWHAGWLSWLAGWLPGGPPGGLSWLAGWLPGGPPGAAGFPHVLDIAYSSNENDGYECAKPIGICTLHTCSRNTPIYQKDSMRSHGAKI